MTIKEITALRKAGQVEEALEAALQEFDKNANKYTAGAVFWCYNDLIKGQSGEEFEANFQRMDELFQDYGSEDEYMSNAMEKLCSKQLPYAKELNDAVEQAKNGTNITAQCREFILAYKAGEIDASLFNKLGWAIYYAIKQTPKTQSGDALKQMLAVYCKLDLPRPSNLHSRILGEVIKIERDNAPLLRIRDFVTLWGLENLQEDDWEQYRTDDGRTLPSLVEKLASVYTKELITDGVAASEEFSQLVDKALEAYPDSQNMPYVKARVLMSQGRMAEALVFYKQLLVKYPSKNYLWVHATNLVEDMDMRIGMLCKAVMSGVDDKFKGAARMKLATVFMRKNLQPNAKYELEKYRETYQREGWGLKAEFMVLYNQLSGVTAAESNADVYAEYGVKAEEFLYSAIPAVLAVKVGESQSDDKNRPGRKVTTWLLRTQDGMVRLRKPAKFGLPKRMPNGAILDLRLHDGKPVWVKQHTGSVEAAWLKEISGTVQLRIDRNGQQYAIVEGAYVGANLLKNVADGQTIRVLAQRQDDGRWAAITRL